MMRRWVGIAAAGLMCGASAVAQTNAPPKPAGPAPTPDTRYARLTLKNLPSLETVLAAAVDTVPQAQVPSLPDWEKKMRKAAWVPRLELRSLIGQQAFRNYRVINQPAEATGTDGTYLTTDSYATGEDPRWLNEYELALTWDFSQLIYRSDEVAIERLKMEVARIRMDREPVITALRERVLNAYYDLVEALRMLEMDTYRSSVPTLIRKEREAAMVDELTGGCILRSLNRPATPPSKP